MDEVLLFIAALATIKATRNSQAPLELFIRFSKFSNFSST